MASVGTSSIWYDADEDDEVFGKQKASEKTRFLVLKRTVDEAWNRHVADGINAQDAGKPSKRCKTGMDRLTVSHISCLLAA